MKKFKVIAGSLSGMFKGQEVKEGDVIGQDKYGSVLTNSLVKRGFLEEIKEEKKEVASNGFDKLKKEELKEKIVELGGEPVDGTKAELISQLEELV